jgi:serine phosphatase RsbU (regulator of sigma subunit)
MIKIWDKAQAVCLLVLLLFSGSILFAQYGNPYLTHFRLPGSISNQNWAFSQGDNDLMYILNRKGIYSFDGLQWDNLEVSGRPIAIAYKKFLFFSTDKGVSYLERQSDGTALQKQILSTSTNNLFYKFSESGNGLLMVSPQAICRLTIDEEIRVDTLFYESGSQVFISDCFELGGQVYFIKNRALLYLLKLDGNVELLDGLSLGEDFSFSFILGEKIILGTSTSRLLEFNGGRLKTLRLNDQKYIAASVLNGGVALNEKSFAISTLNGGCITINATDGSTISTFNYYSGLPDDEVFALGVDRESGLWISHGMGITRVDLSLPIKSLGFYPGLKGNILSSYEFQGKLYVGTSEGLYILDETREYKAIEIDVAKPKEQVIKQDNLEVTQEKLIEQSKVAVEEKKKNFIERLFSRKAQRDADEALLQNTIQHKTPLKDKEPSTRKQKIYELQSIVRSFKKVEGIDGKVRFIIEHKGTLVAASNFGMYEIVGKSANGILKNRNIVFAEESRLGDKVMVGSDKGAYLLRRFGKEWVTSALIESESNLYLSISQVNDNEYLATTEFEVISFKGIGVNRYEWKPIALPSATLTDPIVRYINGKHIVLFNKGVYSVNMEGLQLIPEDLVRESVPYRINISQKGYTWVKQGESWQCLGPESSARMVNTSMLGLLNNPNYFSVNDDGSVYAINDYMQVYKISAKKSEEEVSSISIFLKQLTLASGVPLSPNDVDLTYANNSLKLKISAPSYLAEGGVQFQYRIIGMSPIWSEWTSSPLLDFPFFPPGSYTISVKARDLIGRESNAVSISFTVSPPFWKTPLFFIICGIVVLVLFFFILKVRERSLRKEKEILEQKVKERTKTIEEQNEVLTHQRDELAQYNEEILQQKEEIEAQRDEIEIQRDQIFKQNDEITKSIIYAKRIQTAVMPSSEFAKSLKENYFILFRPRDIVSGDFYWMSARGNKLVLVAADCTGHGVPGAFMSMMGVALLSDIVNVAGELRPNLILSQMRDKIKATLGQTGKEGETRDGMDIAVCVLDSKAGILQYSGAYNPLYLFQKGQFIEYKADKMPVGVHISEKENFTLHEINVSPGDRFYIFSDGYVSQFGGIDGRKFMAKPFKELLNVIQDRPLKEHATILADNLDRWQGPYDQVDDILVMGVEVV